MRPSHRIDARWRRRESRPSTPCSFLGPGGSPADASASELAPLAMTGPLSLARSPHTRPLSPFHEPHAILLQEPPSAAAVERTRDPRSQVEAPPAPSLIEWRPTVTFDLPEPVATGGAWGVSWPRRPIHDSCNESGKYRRLVCLRQNSRCPLLMITVLVLGCVCHEGNFDALQNPYRAYVSTTTSAGAVESAP